MWEMEWRSGLYIDFTLVLTNVALKFMLRGNLPNVPYLTLLDFYVLDSFILIVLMTLENGFISWYVKRHSPEEANDLDFKIWIVIGAMWLTFNLAYGGYTWKFVQQRDARIQALDYLHHTDIEKGKRTVVKYFEDVVKIEDVK